MGEKSMGRLGGPFLTGAFFCERILEEKDGALTPVRIIDTLITEFVGESGPGPDGKTSAPAKTRRQLAALLSFKSGDATGKRTVRIVCKELSVDQTMPILFQGGHHGANLIIGLSLELPAGVHWFSVYLSNKIVTKMPLRVVIRLRQADATSSGAQTTTQEPKS